MTEVPWWPILAILTLVVVLVWIVLLVLMWWGKL
jgi:hypothetical protein